MMKWTDANWKTSTNQKKCCRDEKPWAHLGGNGQAGGQELGGTAILLFNATALQLAVSEVQSQDDPPAIPSHPQPCSGGEQSSGLWGSTMCALFFSSYFQASILGPSWPLPCLKRWRPPASKPWRSHAFSVAWWRRCCRRRSFCWLGGDGAEYHEPTAWTKRKSAPRGSAWLLICVDFSCAVIGLLPWLKISQKIHIGNMIFWVRNVPFVRFQPEAVVLIASEWFRTRVVERRVLLIHIYM